MRRRKRTTPIEPLENVLEAPKAERGIADYLTALDEKYRLPLLLKYDEEMQEKEIAAALHLPLSDEAAFTDDRKQAFRDCLLQAAGSAGVDLPHELEDDLAAIDGQTPNTFYRACSECLFRQLHFADADLLLWLARIRYGVRFGQNAAFRLLHE